MFGRPMFDSTLNACPSSNIHSFLLPGSIPEINFPLLLLSLLFLCFLLLLSSSPSALYCVTRLHVSGTTLQGAEWVDAKGLYNNMNNIYISLPLGNVPESDSHYYYNVQSIVCCFGCLQVPARLFLIFSGKGTGR